MTRVEKHFLVEDDEYVRVTVQCLGDVLISIREYVRAGIVVRYSYQLLVGGEDVLRYDNAPHHPEVETHPHHRHRGGRVHPLHNPSLQAFLEEVTRILTARQP